jgi:hypothetical protein
MIKVIAYSAWQKPQEFFCDEKELKELVRELKSQQYSVEVVENYNEKEYEEEE